MGIINRTDAWELERSQNGIAVTVNKSGYDSIISPEVTEVYTGICFTEETTGKVLYAYEWIHSNLCIFPSTYDRYINAFLEWVTIEKPDTYTIEKTAEKAFFNNSCLSLLVYAERKKKERVYEEQQRKAREQRETEEKEIADTCIERGLNLYKTINALYVVDFSEPKYKELFDRATGEQIDGYMDMIKQGAHGVTIRAEINPYVGHDEIMEQIKTL